MPSVSMNTSSHRSVIMDSRSTNLTLAEPRSTRDGVFGELSRRSMSHQPRSSRKHERLSWLQHPRQVHHLYLALLILISSCCTLTSAASIKLSISDELVETTGLSRSTLDRLTLSGPILVDPRPAPQINGANKAWTLGTVEDDLVLQRRQFESSTSTVTKTKTISSATGSSTLAPSTTTGGSSVAGTTAATPLPSAFDSGIGTNFSSQSCENFINSFLSNSTFKACVPISLMLQNSNSFFQAEKSIVTITEVLDSSCAVNATACSNLMSSLASNLTTSTNCQTDYQNQNPTVIAARLGLLAYLPTYQATCLKDNSTSAYCFAEAITNASSPTDSYIYYLPLNTSLPGGSQPTCDKCLQNTMAIFESSASDKSSALASTYVGAAQQVNVQCGPSFVNTTIPAASTSAANAAAKSPAMGMIALVILVAAWLL